MRSWVEALRIGLCLASYVVAQTSAVPYATYGDGTGPMFSVSTEVHSYPGSYRSVREIDFRNLNNGSVALRNGIFRRDEKFDHYEVNLDSVEYLDNNSALVIYRWLETAGSSSSGEDAVVFTVSEGHLRTVQSIKWQTHSAGQRSAWSFEPNTLIIRSDHYRPGDAHCCISAVDSSPLAGMVNNLRRQRSGRSYWIAK